MFIPTYASPTPRPDPVPTWLEHQLVTRELGKSDVLYFEGDEAESVFRIDEGLVKLSIDLPSGKERIVSIAGPGDFVGAVTSTSSAYQETSTALSPRVRVSAAAAQPVDDSLTPHLRHAAGTQLSRMRETLEDSDLPVAARLARTFVRLGERFGTTTQGGTVHLTLPLTHDNLAAMIGAARETTTATLGELRDAGVLTGTRGRYRFQRDVLSDFANTASAF